MSLFWLRLGLRSGICCVKSLPQTLLARKQYYKTTTTSYVLLLLLLLLQQEVHTYLLLLEVLPRSMYVPAQNEKCRLAASFVAFEGANLKFKCPFLSHYHYCHQVTLNISVEQESHDIRRRLLFRLFFFHSSRLYLQIYAPPAYICP